MTSESSKPSSTFSAFLKKLLRLHNSGEVEPTGVNASDPHARPVHLSSRSPSAANSIMSYPSIISDNAEFNDIGSELHAGKPAGSGQGQTTIVFNVDSSSGGTRLGQTPGQASGHSSRPAPDTASVLTIASSSKRRRRRSLDTNASTRALVAESILSNCESVETDL